MRDNKQNKYMHDELGPAYIMGLWLLLLATIIGVVFSVISLVSGKGSFIDVVIVIGLSGFTIGILRVIKKVKGPDDNEDSR